MYTHFDRNYLQTNKRGNRKRWSRRPNSDSSTERKGNLIEKLWFGRRRRGRGTDNLLQRLHIVGGERGEDSRVDGFEARRARERLHEPLVNAFLMERVHTRQETDALSRLEVDHANGASREKQILEIFVNETNSLFFISPRKTSAGICSRSPRMRFFLASSISWKFQIVLNPFLL